MDGAALDQSWKNEPPYANNGQFAVKYRAQCFCGTVAFEVCADPVDSKICHCTSVSPCTARLSSGPSSSTSPTCGSSGASKISTSTSMSLCSIKGRLGFNTAAMTASAAKPRDLSPAPRSRER